MHAARSSRGWIVPASLFLLAGSLAAGCGRIPLDPGPVDSSSVAGAPGSGQSSGGSGGQIDASSMTGVGGARQGAGGATTGTGGGIGGGGAGAAGLGIGGFAVGGSAGAGPPTSANYAINPSHD